MYYDKRTTTRMKKISSRILFMFMLLLVMVPAGFAQDKTSTTKNETESQEVFIENRVAELEAKLQSVKEQIDEVKQPETESVRLQYGISEDELNKYAQLLEETEAVIQQQITAIKKQASLQQLQKRMENVLSSPQNLAVPLLPPYSLSVLDEYLDEQEAQNLLDETAELAREVAQKNLEDAQLNYDKAEQNLRKIKEDADAQVGKENQVVYEFTKIVAQLEFDLAEAALNLNQVYLQNAETEVNLNKQQSSILKNQTELIRDNLEYDEEDLQEKLKNTETIRQQHNERIQSLASEQQEVEAKWLKAQEQFDSIKDRDENTKLIAKAWLDEREAWKNTYQQALVQTENIFRLLSYGDEIWHRRYALLQGNYNPNQLVEWLQELESS
ncbi:MAG: hypothetical protein OES33_10790, partial [Desulfobulbaceae bacterium]|nr:hypothetical protein [Desulfobulbaceae bacterium]